MWVYLRDVIDKNCFHHVHNCVHESEKALLVPVSTHCLPSLQKIFQIWSITQKISQKIEKKVKKVKRRPAWPSLNFFAFKSFLIPANSCLLVFNSMFRWKP